MKENSHGVGRPGAPGEAHVVFESTGESACQHSVHFDFTILETRFCRGSVHEERVITVLRNFTALPLQAQLLARAIFRAAQKDWTDRSMSSEVVAQEQTLTRMTERPCQVEAPHQHSPIS